MSQVGWITCRDLPEPDPDEAPATAALEAAGLNVERLVWDRVEPRAAAGLSLALLRSPWNYFEAPDRFSTWLAGLAESCPLLNPLPAARWNLHKRYLEQLAGEGVEIIPTAFLERGMAVDLAALVDERGWGAFVIKPAISAGSFATRRFSRSEIEAAVAFLAQHLVERDMLVQVYVDSVASMGERCYVWIDGGFSHAVDKHPRFSGDDESVSGALELHSQERELGERILTAALKLIPLQKEALLYARVDTVTIGDRRVLSELELLEPSLFLLQSPSAMAKFVEAVAKRARAGAAS